MKIYQVYIHVSILFFLGCTNSNEKNGIKISKKQTVVSGDTLNLAAAALKLVVITDTTYLDSLFKSYGLVDVQSLDSSIKVNLKYADTLNFLKINIYQGLKKAYFPCEVAIGINNAQVYLKTLNPDYSLIIFDAARPLHIQQMMWDSLDMPPDIKYAYLSPPYSISLHNYGCAVDLSIINLKTNKLLNMGTDFDFFGKLSQPAYEWHFLKTKELLPDAFENRKLLRKVMQQARFYPITSEWWHFNYCTKEFAALKYKLIK